MVLAYVHSQRIQGYWSLWYVFCLSWPQCWRWSWFSKCVNATFGNTLAARLTRYRLPLQLNESTWTYNNLLTCSNISLINFVLSGLLGHIESGYFSTSLKCWNSCNFRACSIWPKVWTSGMISTPEPIDFLRNFLSWKKVQINMCQYKK